MRFPLIFLFMLSSFAARADAPRVAADIAPVHGLVARVMEGVGVPDLVIPPGASPHGYAMRPSEARALSQADVVFWIGPALTPWLSDPIETLAGAARHVTLSEVEGLTLLAYRDGARFEPHDHGHDDHAEKDEHGHADGHDEAHDHGHTHERTGGHHDAPAHADDDGHAEDHAGHMHDAQAIDGHLWLDPQNAVVLLGAIAGTLAEFDSAHAAVYRANAEAAQAEIAALRAEIAQQLAPVAERPFIVFHDAYHYFERAFGLSAVAAITLGDAGAAGAARLAGVREVVRETDARCALAEPRASAGLVDAVAQDSGIRIATLDAIGFDLEPGPGYYPALLRQVADGLSGCLSDR